MSIGKIEYNIDQPWIVNQLNEIGPTADVNYRPESALINPDSNVVTKDDSDTIYLDPINGNNTNSGFTLQLAVRTFDEAVSKITSSGRTYIHIDVFDGKFKSSFPTSTYDVLAIKIRGIAFDPDGTLWVTDDDTHKIYHITQSGTLLGSFLISDYAGAGLPIRGLAVDPNGTLWTTHIDGGFGKIFNFTKTGAFIKSFFTSEYDVLAIAPNGIAVDPNGTLWVTDASTDTIYNIGKDGTFIDSFLSTTYDTSALNPWGIAVKSNGTLWIADSTNGEIYNATRKGSFISVIPSTNYAPAGQDPVDIAVDSNGTLWVASFPENVIYNISVNNVLDLEVECDLGGAAVDVSGTAIKAQVTPGKTARVTFDGAYYWTGIGGQTNEFHGLFLEALNPKVPFTIVSTPIPLITFDIYPPFGVDPGITGGIFWKFDWCDLEMLAFACQQPPTANVSIFRQLAGETVFNNKVFFLTVAAGIFDRNIFLSNDTTKTWFLMASNPAPVTLTNNTFQTGFAIFQSSAANSGVVTIHSNIINGFTKFNNVVGTVGGTFKPEIEYSLLNFNNAVIDPNIDTTSGNNIFDRNPIFRNLGTDFRLQKIGVLSASGFPFAFNSPAIETGSGGKDMGAYDITYEKGDETYDTLIMDTDGCENEAYDNVLYKLVRINYREWHMIKGEYKNDFDATCVEATFTHSKNYFTGTKFTQLFKKMFQTKGLKRYFPEGELGISLGIGINSAVDPYQLTLTDLDGRAPLIDNWFDGWVLRIIQPSLIFADTNSKRIYTTQLDGTLILTTLFLQFTADIINVTGIDTSPIRQTRTIYLLDDANDNGFIYHVSNPAISLISKTAIDSIDSNWTAPAGIYADYNGLWITVFDNAFNKRIIVRLDLEFNVINTILDFDNVDSLTKDAKGLLWLLNKTKKTASLSDFESRNIVKTIPLTGTTAVADIAVSSGNIMWAVDNTTNTVHKLNKDGGTISTFLTTDFDAAATNTTAMSMSVNPILLEDTNVLIKSFADGVFETKYLTGFELTFPLKDDTEFYISHLPSQLKMPSMDAPSEYYIDGNRTPWYKDKSNIEPEELHIRKWILKQGKEKPFE